MATKAQISAIQSDPRYGDLCACIEQCWQAIGGDAEQACAEEGIYMKRAGRLEMCIDANRMQMYPGGEIGKASDAFVTELCSAGKYDALMKALKLSNVLY